MKSYYDPDKTPERRIFYCHFCGEEINEFEVVKCDGQFAHEECKWEVERLQEREYEKMQEQLNKQL